jgi:hypothetical protein
VVPACAMTRLALTAHLDSSQFPAKLPELLFAG